MFSTTASLPASELPFTFLSPPHRSSTSDVAILWWRPESVAKSKYCDGWLTNSYLCGGERKRRASHDAPAAAGEEEGMNYGAHTSSSWLWPHVVVMIAGTNGEAMLMLGGAYAPLEHPNFSSFAWVGTSPGVGCTAASLLNMAGATPSHSCFSPTKETMITVEKHLAILSFFPLHFDFVFWKLYFWILLEAKMTK